MKDLVGEFSRLGDVVMDFCAGIGPTAKICILLDKHRKFVGCNVDSELLTAAEAGLVVILVSQMLNPKSHISGSARMIAAAKAFREEWAALLASKRPVCRKSRHVRMLRKHCRVIYCTSP